MPFVPVPKDLAKVKTKVAFNLTKRQIVCFGAGGLVGVPAYIFTRGSIGNEPAALLMIGLMLPFFLFGIYEKDGQPLEAVLRHTEYSQRVESCLDRKRVLYEQVLLKEITLEEYKAQKADVDAELERLRQVQGALSAEIAQAKMDAKTKNARLELAQEISAASGLNTALADALIERVDIHPGNQVDIVWKMKDFCTEGM